MGTLKKFIFFYFVNKLLKIIAKIFGIVENYFILLNNICVCAYMCVVCDISKLNNTLFLPLFKRF